MGTSNYRLYEYDLWGNIADGFDVNDIRKTNIVLELDDEVWGKPLVEAIYKAWPVAAKLVVQVEDGDDEVLYLTREDDDGEHIQIPYGELRRESLCGHSACTQNYIDTGVRACVRDGAK